jgi:hypothetical protein
MKQLFLATGLAMLTTQAFACSATVINGEHIICPRPEAVGIYAPQPLPTIPSTSEVVTTNRALRELRSMVRRDQMVWGD